MKTNKLRKVIALLAAICLLGTMVISVSARDEVYNFTVTAYSAVGSYDDGYEVGEEIETAKPGDVIALEISCPAQIKLNGSMLAAYLGEGSEIAKYANPDYIPDDYDEEDPSTWEFLYQMDAGNHGTQKSPKMWDWGYVPEDDFVSAALTVQTTTKDVPMGTIYIQIGKDAANDPATGKYTVIKPELANSNFLGLNEDGGTTIYTDCLAPFEITLVDDEEVPVMPEDIEPTGKDSQWGATVEAKVMEDGTATMRAFFEVAEQKDAEGAPVASFNLAGSYIVPLSVFEGYSTTTTKKVELSLVDQLSVGDVFATDLTDIPDSEFDTAFVFIAFTGVKGEEDAPNQYWYGINADQSNTVNSKNIENY